MFKLTQFKVSMLITKLYYFLFKVNKKLFNQFINSI